MMDDSMRAKARAAFGKEFMNVMKPQAPAKNEAVALQQRANARPIPTYKVGGPVKKVDGGKVAGRSAESDDVLMSTRRGQQMLDEQKRREAAKAKSGAAKRTAADKLLGIPAQKKGGKAGCYADGGAVEDARVAARMAAGNYKKGGKAKKDGLAVMIAIGKPIKEKATGEMYPSKKAMAKHEAAESAGMERMERMKPMKKMDGGADFDMAASKASRGMNKGGKAGCYAAGGAGKVRKGQAPIKRAQGGAAKVRKGMMSPTGDIKQVVHPKKGLGGF